MKRISFLFISLFFLIGSGLAQQAIPSLHAVRTPQTYDTTLSYRITQKISDSLHLTPEQKIVVRSINNYVDSSKVAIIRVYHGRDSLVVYMKRIERVRDSLYHRVLTDKQYVQYGKQKSTLVLNN